MNSNKSFKKYSGRIVPFGYYIAVILLILSIFFLRPTIYKLKEYYRKEPIAIVKPLKEFDVSKMPSFVDWRTKVMEVDTGKEDLGTDEFILLRLQQPDGQLNPIIVELFVTYYSDPDDKVPHTPDVCFRQAGGIVKKLSTVEIDIPSYSLEDSTVKAIYFESSQEVADAAVMYLFYADGHIRNRREQVRWLITKPGNRYVYFSKIEVRAFLLPGMDLNEVGDVCKKMIAEALPLLIKNHYPSNDQLKIR